MKILSPWMRTTSRIFRPGMQLDKSQGNGPAHPDHCPVDRSEGHKPVRATGPSLTTPKAFLWARLSMNISKFVTVLVFLILIPDHSGPFFDTVFVVSSDACLGK